MRGCSREQRQRGDRDPGSNKRLQRTPPHELDDPGGEEELAAAARPGLRGEESLVDEAVR